MEERDVCKIKREGQKKNSGGGRRASLVEEDVREACMHARENLLDARQISHEFLK